MPSPALPLHLAELVLYYAPRVNIVNSHTLYDLSRVLPRSLVPNAFVCLTLVVNGYLQCTRKWTEIREYSLERLVKALSPQEVMWLTHLLMPKLTHKPAEGLQRQLAPLFVELLTKRGALDALTLLHDRKVPMQGNTVLETASHFGHVHVLEWWMEISGGFGGSLDNDLDYAFVRAAEGGHRNVLSWWMYQREFSEDAVKMAAIEAAKIGDMECVDELLEVTDGWEWGGGKFWYAASLGGNVAILDAAKWRGAPFPRRSSEVMDIASGTCHVHVLDWWFLNAPDLSVLYSHKALDDASRLGYMSVLNWWARSGLELRFTPRALQQAVLNRKWDVVAWWQGLGVYKYIVHGQPSSLDAEDLAKNRLVPKDRITLASFGRLDWMQPLCPMTAETPFAEITRVQDVATMFGHVHVLEAYKHLFDGNEDRNHERHDTSSLVLTTAVENGHRACMLWVAQNMSRFFIPSYVLMECAEKAIECANLGIVVDLVSNPVIRQAIDEEGSIFDLFVIACRNDQSDNATAILDFLYDQLGDRPSDALTRAALTAAMQEGQVHVFQWWTSNKLHVLCETSSALFQEAILLGTERIMDWFLYLGYFGERKTITRATIDSLIAKRHFPTLYWITERHRLLDLPQSDRKVVADALRRVNRWSGPEDFLSS